MFSDNSKGRGRKNISTAESIANTFEWLITAFILAFVFRAFVMEAFRIPTGSMAETLKGDHWQMGCPQCGYKYDFNFTHTRGSNLVNGIATLPEASRCPSCGYYSNYNGRMPISNGDRILVLKCIYQFTDPKRWDVVVFKNPQNPRENYIKRMIARPGETIELIDGDVYINSEIARKPAKVQNELWMPVYDNDYRPVHPKEGHFNGHCWTQPFENDRKTGSAWLLYDENKASVFTLNDSSEVHTAYYDSAKNPSANNFGTTYAYNQPSRYKYMPDCSDLMVQFYVDVQSDDVNDLIGISLRKYKTVYTARYYIDKQTVVLEKKVDHSNPIILGEKQIKFKNKSMVSFANVDHLLVFELAGEKFQIDMGRGADDIGAIVNVGKPKAAILGSGKLELSHIKVFRDTCYLDKNSSVLRANQGNPFTLGEDEFFVMGDNSPASFDSRMWPEKGFSNEGVEPYRAGIVPRDYLVGKAFFVYWPSGFRPSPYSAIPFLRIPIIPNVGQLRFIVGGKSGL